jgi:hypothetical protein
VLSGALCAALAAVLTTIAARQMQTQTLPANGSISGTVRDHDGNPVELVQVILASSTGTVHQPVITNQTGVYKFADVAPGTYAVTVESHGDTLQTTRYVNLVVAAGQAVQFDAKVERGDRDDWLVFEVDANPNRSTASPEAKGTITGRVFSADGSPAIAITVAAVPESSAPSPNGILVLGNAIQAGIAPVPPSMVTALAQTDNLGRYRLESVPPGRYYLAAGIVLKRRCGPQASCGGSPNAFQPFMRQPSFFPQPPDPPLTVNSGTPLSVEFRLAPSSLFKVSGQILEKNPAPRGYEFQPRMVLMPLNEPCSLIDEMPLNPESRIQGGVTPDGLFELRDVPSGQYRVCFRHWARTSSQIEVSRLVVDRDMAGLSFSLR